MLMLSACSPSLDWREVRPEGAGLLALFPCKPEINSRPATAAEPSRMGLAQCKAGGLSFAIAWAELPDPALVTPALQQMREALSSKLAAAPAASAALSVPGMTPNAEAQTVAINGAQQQARVAVFTRGRLVFQAVMLGDKGNAAAWESFVGSIRLDS